MNACNEGYIIASLLTALTWFILSFVLSGWSRPLDFAWPAAIAGSIVYFGAFKITQLIIKENAYRWGFANPSRFKGNICRMGWGSFRDSVWKDNNTDSFFPFAVTVIGIPILIYATVLGFYLYGENEITKISLISHVSVDCKRGPLSTDLLVTNKDQKSVIDGREIPPIALSKCDLQFTVVFVDGTKTEIGRFWKSWTVGETKTINFASRGGISRIVMKGSVYDFTGKVKNEGEWPFEFKTPR